MTAGSMLDIGPHGAKLVERRDDAMAQRAVRLEQALDQRLLRFRGADPQQHRRQLAPHFDWHVLVAKRRDNAGDDRVPEARQGRLAGFVRELGAAERQR